MVRMDTTSLNTLESRASSSKTSRRNKAIVRPLRALTFKLRRNIGNRCGTRHQYMVQTNLIRFSMRVYPGTLASSRQFSSKFTLSNFLISFKFFFTVIVKVWLRARFQVSLSPTSMLAFGDHSSVGTKKTWTYTLSTTFTAANPSSGTQ